jgi:hypothetical protein
VGVVEVHEQVAGLFGEPDCGRVGGDVEDVHAAGGVFEYEEHAEPVQGDRVHGEVGSRAPFDVAIVGFPRTSSRTRRAPLSAPGAPRVVASG